MAVFDDFSGISVASGFKLQAKAALDGRQQVEDLTARDELVTSNGAWEGMRVYVKSEKKSYILKGETNADWVELPDADAVSTDIGAELDIANVKTLAAVTDATFEYFGAYPSDIYYNNNEIIIVTQTGRVASLQGISGGTNTNAGCTLPNNANSDAYALFVNDDAVYVFDIDAPALYKLNRTTLARTATYTINVDSSSGESIVNKSFAVFGNTLIYTVYVEDGSESATKIMKKDISTTTGAETEFSTSVPSGTNVSIFYDYLNENVCFIRSGTELHYVTYDPDAGTFTTKYCAPASGSGISSVATYVDYFNYFYLEVTDNAGLQLKIHDLNSALEGTYTFKTYTVTFEDEELPVGSSTTLYDVLIKKKTLDNKLQYYLGFANGIHLKFVVDLNGAADGDTLISRLMYEFIDPNMKKVKRIVADDLKNTEKILVLYDSMAAQVRVLSENVEVAGATQLSKMFDDLKSANETLETKANSSTVSSQISTVQNSINTLSGAAFKSRGVFTKGTLDACNSYDSFGIWAMSYSSYTASDLPLSRTANETILLVVYGDSSSASAVVQMLYYTKQKRTFMRYYDGSTWSSWASSGASTFYGESAGGTTLTVSCTGFVLEKGAEITVKFTGAVSASATLNVNGTGAKTIRYRGSTITANKIRANSVHKFSYDGTYYNVVGDLDTTYSVATTTTNGLLSADDKVKMDMLMPVFVSDTEPEDAPVNSLWFRVIDQNLA